MQSDNEVQSNQASSFGETTAGEFGRTSEDSPGPTKQDLEQFIVLFNSKELCVSHIPCGIGSRLNLDTNEVIVDIIYNYVIIHLSDECPLRNK